MNAYDIIKKPRMTEKSVYLQNNHHTYTFDVHPSANKTQIREAVQTLFKVKVTAVTTQNYDGKWRKIRSKLPGRTPGWKKAMVTLAEGQSIEGI